MMGVDLNEGRNGTMIEKHMIVHLRPTTLAALIVDLSDFVHPPYELREALVALVGKEEAVQLLHEATVQAAA
jgi:hypothetical protein